MLNVLWSYPRVFQSGYTILRFHRQWIGVLFAHDSGQYRSCSISLMLANLKDEYCHTLVYLICFSLKTNDACVTSCAFGTWVFFLCELSKSFVSSFCFKWVATYCKSSFHILKSLIWHRVAEFSCWIWLTFFFLKDVFPRKWYYILIKMDRPNSGSVICICVCVCTCTCVCVYTFFLEKLPTIRLITQVFSDAFFEKCYRFRIVRLDL